MSNGPAAGSADPPLYIFSTVFLRTCGGQKTHCAVEFADAMPFGEGLAEIRFTNLMRGSRRGHSRTGSTADAAAVTPRLGRNAAAVRSARLRDVETRPGVPRGTRSAYRDSGYP